MYSPWGRVQNKRVHQRGLTWVSTASHGGFMVSQSFAEKRLSAAALKRALRYGSYYCYEEDCDCCIVFNEIPLKDYGKMTEAEFKEANYLNLSRFNPDYLLEVGIEPEASRYADWTNDRVDAKRRAEKDPNLVVAGVRLDDNIGQVKAWTADGKEHTVTENSYQRVMFESRTHNLSDMTLIR